jgi:hypothetical protein
MDRSREEIHARWNDLIKQGNRRMWRRFALGVAVSVVSSLAGALLVQWLLSR